MCRKNNVSEFIPDRQPDFPDKKFEKVSGDAFFIDESLLVTHLFFFLSFICVGSTPAASSVLLWERVQPHTWMFGQRVHCSEWMNMNYMNAFIIIQTSCCCQVYPIQGFPDQEICDVSTKLINEHLVRFTATSRILQQVQIRTRGPLGRSQTRSSRFVALCRL